MLSDLDAPAPYETGADPAPDPESSIGADLVPYEIGGDPAAPYDINSSLAAYEIGVDPRVASSTTDVASQPQNSVSLPNCPKIFVGPADVISPVCH